MARSDEESQLPSRRAPLTGWGRTSPTVSTIFHPTEASEVAALIESPGRRGAISRGLGRSYGDAAQNAGGRVLDLTSMSKILDMDLEQGTITVQPGVSLDFIMRRFVPQGWFPAVTPGTRQVTVGGAIAADIHGKNHHRDGSFCNFVSSITLQTPSKLLVVSPDTEPDVFWATAGGMGLTGFIVEATLRLQSIETSYVRVDTERTVDLEDTMERMITGDDRYKYSVAWIDCLSRGRGLGRSVITRGDHATFEELPSRLRNKALTFEPRVRASAPRWFPGGLLNTTTVKVFNELWYRKSPALRLEEIVPLHAFFHPLDSVNGWNSVYGPAGFLQYQFVVPYGAEDALRRSLEMLSDKRCASFLAVLKRFGPPNPGMLSFPIAGWTLALDIRAGFDGLAELLDALDEMVASSGGRIYLAKDSRLRPELMARMYPRLDEFKAVLASCDPDSIMVSDLARRLGLH